jgi:hypothetical protein
LSVVGFVRLTQYVAVDVAAVAASMPPPVIQPSFVPVQFTVVAAQLGVVVVPPHISTVHPDGAVSVIVTVFEAPLVL